MYQILETSHQEKMEMYMKLSKKELVGMLIEANRQIASRGPVVINGQDLVNKLNMVGKIARRV